ncbi:MAG: accessory gene regulator B family protein [Oenococcus oeni]
MERKKTMQEMVAAYLAKKLVSPSNKITFAKLEYGLSVLILNITKMTAVFFLAFLMKDFKISFMSFIFFSMLRVNIFGRHASNNVICTLETCGLFVLLPIFIAHVFNGAAFIIIMLLAVVLIFIFAPRYTNYTARQSPRKTRNHRIKATLTSMIIVSLTLLSREPSLQIECCTALVISIFVILPTKKEIIQNEY